MRTGMHRYTVTGIKCLAMEAACVKNVIMMSEVECVGEATMAYAWHPPLPDYEPVPTCVWTLCLDQWHVLFFDPQGHQPTKRKGRPDGMTFQAIDDGNSAKTMAALPERGH